MGKKEAQLTSKNLKRAKRILYDVIELLDKYKIEYHLEGGTLLGLVRDKDLLPWDHDVDISIPKDKVESFLRLRRKLLFKGYKISTRRSRRNFGPIVKGDYSVLKVKPIGFYLLYMVCRKAKKNLIVLDVFIKTMDKSYAYWQASNKVMRVDAKYYKSFETVDALGKEFRVPFEYKNYLTEKYGDWSITVKEWNCINEKTVVEKLPDQEL